MSSTTATPAKAASLAPAFQDHLNENGPARLPAWWTERKRAAFAEFERTPYPKRRDERWRFSSVDSLAVEGYDFTATATREEAAALVGRSNEIAHAAGRLVFADHTLGAWEPVSAELAAKGVVFMPLDQALATQPDLLKEHFAAQSTRLGADKFAALHSAFVRCGVIIRIPDNVEVELPLAIYHWAHTPNAALFPHTLILAGKNSKVSVVDFFFTEGGKTQPHLAVSMSHIFADEGAKVFYTVFQDWSEQALAFHLVSLDARRDAYVKNLAVNLGGHQFRSETQSLLNGPGSRVETYSLSVTEADQEIDQRTLQIHNAPNASSDLLFKNALMDDSRTIFSGLIQVAPEGQKTDAYQSNRNLLLSPTAEANSLPGLEISANDVRCTHGSTTGQIDESELFYLMARGIKPDIARQLLVFGFFDEVIQKVDNEELAQSLRKFVESKFQTHG
jgi:Fe-S cluster assembly protein SufD